MMLKDNLKNWTGFFGVFALIFYLSSLQGGGMPLLPFADSVKAMHFFIYFILGFTFTRAIYNQSRYWRLQNRWMILAFVMAPSFAVFDEWHQSFVSGRSVEFLDGVFDVLGFSLAILTFALAQRTALRKRFLPLAEMRQNIWLYRLQLTWAFWLILFWDLYFYSFPLRSSNITKAMGQQSFLLLWQAACWIILAVLWARFWLWESWWQAKSQNKLWHLLGYSCGLLFLLLESICRWQAQTALNWVLLQSFAFCIYTVVFGLYDLGWWQMQRHQMPKPEPEAPACELPNP